MKAPVEDYMYARDTFPLGEGDTRVRQIIQALEVQPEGSVGFEAVQFSGLQA